MPSAEQRPDQIVETVEALLSAKLWSQITRGVSQLVQGAFASSHKNSLQPVLERCCGQGA